MNSSRINPRLALYSLVIAHLLAGWIVGAFVYEDTYDDGPMAILFFGLYFSQIALAAFWGTFGLSSQRVRVSTALVGSLYLHWMISPAMNVIDTTVIMFLLGNTVIVFLPLWAMRLWLARLSDAWPKDQTGAQFQLRHLFILTFAVSLLLAVGKWLPPGSLMGVGDAIGLIIFAIAFGSIGVAAVFAMLNKSSIWIPTLLLLGYVTSAGWFLDTRFENRSNTFIATKLLATDAFLLVVSLGIVRLCGYRLVPLRQTAEILPEGSPFFEVADRATNNLPPVSIESTAVE